MSSILYFVPEARDEKMLRKHRKVLKEYYPGQKLDAGRRIYSLLRDLHVRA